MKSPTINLSSALAALNRRSQCCSDTESVPLGPAPPESRPATAVMVLLVMSTIVSSGGHPVRESGSLRSAAYCNEFNYSNFYYNEFKYFNYYCNDFKYFNYY